MASQSRAKWQWLRRTFRWIFRALGLLILVLHLYAVMLKYVPVPGTLNMLLTAQKAQILHYQWVDIEAISAHLIEAVLAAEDSRFCSHAGLSLSDIQQALAERKQSGRLRGASTLSQQTAKNVFFWNGGGYLRKAGEAWMAVFIDFVWGKQRLMEVYLNVAEWGDGVFGAQAAAQARFGKSAARLTPYEAALLAAVLPSPNRYRLDPPTPYVRKQARTYQARMAIVKRDALAACVR